MELTPARVAPGIKRRKLMATPLNTLEERPMGIHGTARKHRLVALPTTMALTLTETRLIVQSQLTAVLAELGFGGQRV